MTVLQDNAQIKSHVIISYHIKGKQSTSSLKIKKSDQKNKNQRIQEKNMFSLIYLFFLRNLIEFRAWPFNSIQRLVIIYIVREWTHFSLVI